MTIDDKLPSVAGELLYTHTLENDEHWMCVMEKAYAKSVQVLVNLALKSIFFFTLTWA